MTIQDYFRRAGVGGAAIGGRSDSRQTVRGTDKGFADALAHARVAAPSPPTGRRIADYLRSPVSARLPRIQPVPASLKGEASPEERALAVPRPVDGLGRVASAGAEGALPAGGDVAPAAAPSPETPLEAPKLRGTGVAAQIDRGIQKAAAKYGLPAGLIRSVIRAESNFEVRAVSPAGAQGLMQLMPATARELGVRDPFDIEQNIDGGSRYLRRMLDRFGGDLKLALSAYNAGPGKVVRYNGDVPYRETRDYVRRVLAFNQRYTAEARL